MNSAKLSGIAPALLAEMEEAVRQALTDRRDPAAMLRACERMDRMRAEVCKRWGTLDIGGPAIRQLRDAQ